VRAYNRAAAAVQPLHTQGGVGPRSVPVGQRHPEGVTAAAAEPGTGPAMTTTPPKPTAPTPTTATATPTHPIPTHPTQTVRRSSNRRTRKARNGNPISITTRADGRRTVSWYPSGVAGVGPRKQSTVPNQREALAKAAGLTPTLTENAVTTRAREALNGGDLRDRRATPFGTTITELVEILIDRDVADGSLRAYTSNIRTWIPQEVKAVPCRDLKLHHYTSIFDAMAQGNASKPVVRNVGRTLGKLIKMGTQRNYFAAGDFGSATDRAEVLKTAKDDATFPTKRRNEVVLRADCPDVEDVERLAAASELVYPDYGARLVGLLFASGLRMCETLALRVEDVNLDELTLSVTQQLSRYRSWPAVTDPKNGHHRTTVVWAYYAEVLSSLVDDATHRDIDRGYLFPRTKAQPNWPDAVDKLLSRAITDCAWEWTPHWLRHSYATLSLASKDSGGYGIKLESVSQYEPPRVVRRLATLEGWGHGREHVEEVPA
jgi:integrase